MEPITLQILLVELATFLVGAVLLWHIAYRPIRRILEERRERIAKAQAEADEARKRAEDLERDLARRVARIEAEAKKQIHKAELEGRKLREKMVASARAHAQGVMEQARDQLKRERRDFEERLRKGVARTSVAMAKKVTGAILKAADQRRLIKRVIEKLPRSFEGKA